MSIVRVRAFFTKIGRQNDILEFSVSSATVELAAQALGVAGARIAKSIAFAGADGSCVLVVAAGDAKVSSSLFKKRFGIKAKMLDPEQTLEKTGYAIGGVCPFALPEGVSVVLDRSLLRFATVFPACGSASSAIELTPLELEDLTSGEWLELCTVPEQ